MATLALPARRRLDTRGHQALVLFVVVAPLVATLYAVCLLWERAVSEADLALLLAMYVPTSLGITVGYHRLLAHRSFQAPAGVRLVLLILGSMAIEGAPLDWVANHRQHHALADKPGDPHSPLDGLFHAHLGWLFNGRQADPGTYCRDLQHDRLVRFVDATNVVWSLLSLVVPFALGGWSGLLWGGFVRTFLLHHATWSVNSVCHTFGQRTFATGDDSRNNWLVGLLALGEGWHNNHHAFPRSAVHGLDAQQVDISAWLICGLAGLGLAHDVQRPSTASLARRRVATLGLTVSDPARLDVEASQQAQAHDGTLRFAAALVQDGVTGVTLVIPRVPGIVRRARSTASAAGVEVCAERISSATITLRFSAA